MIIRQKTALKDSFVKVVVDIEREILSAGCDLHLDCAEELLKDDSKSEHLWGANVYQNPARIEFTSVINIRPAQNNRSLEITRSDVREKVERVVKRLLSS